MNEYKSSSRPAVFGAVAVTLTAVTIALAIVLPASMDSGSRVIREVVAPADVPPAADLGPGPIRIDVVARRDGAGVPAHTHATTWKGVAHESARSGARAVATPEHLGDADDGLRKANCPYLIRGTVAATS
ncbi:MAG TPA: hypothetical protein VGK37_11620 [Casimicrobiaceae bacterium]|jgi:hypothetical protein